MFKKQLGKNVIVIAALLLMVFGLIGCGGGSSGGGNPGGGGTLQGPHAYVVNGGDGSGGANFSLFSITDGTLTQIGASVATEIYEPSSLALDPSGKYLYIDNRGNGTIAAFSISGTGVLNLIGSPVSTGGTNSASLAVDPSGNYLYVTNNSINGNDGGITIFNINAGKLTQKGSATITTGVNIPGASVIVGNYLYVTNWNDNSISVFKIDNGILTVISGSPFETTTTPGGTGANNIAVDHNGKYLYVTNYLSHDVSVFSIESSTGVPTLKQSVVGSGGTHPVSLVVDPKGQYLYVANVGTLPDTGCISVFNISNTNGTLSTPCKIVKAGVDQPSTLAIDSSGYLYVGNYSKISVYSNTAGDLTQIGSSVDSGGQCTSDIVIH